MVALGRVMLTTREHVLAIEPRGKGLLGVTLRYPYEIRKEEDYFGDLRDEQVPEEMVELAIHIVTTKAGHFQPKEFEDHYEGALRELIKKKQRGEKIGKPRQHPSAKVINLMDALRRSAAVRDSSLRPDHTASAEGKRASRKQPSARTRSAS
jgi:DNA end-binding protein Ku